MLRLLQRLQTSLFRAQCSHLFPQVACQPRQRPDSTDGLARAVGSSLIVVSNAGPRSRLHELEQLPQGTKILPQKLRHRSGSHAAGYASHQGNNSLEFKEVTTQGQCGISVSLLLQLTSMQVPVVMRPNFQVCLMTPTARPRKVKPPFWLAVWRPIPAPIPECSRLASVHIASKEGLAQRRQRQMRWGSVLTVLHLFL